MKKFTTILSLVAVVASVLFVSCAQKKDPDVVPAFPTKKPASYVWNQTKKAYEWTYESTYGNTNAKGGGFKKNSIATILDYVITPNADWTANVVGDGAEYVQLRQGYGYNEDNYTYAATASGVKGKSTIGLCVVNQPEFGEADKVVEIELNMCGETMTIATLTISCKQETVVEDPGEGGDEDTGEEE